LPDGGTISIVLDWDYVPYIDELQMWILNDWDLNLNFNENMRRFGEAADYFVRTGTKPKHPIGWALDKVYEFLDNEDDDEDEEEEEDDEDDEDDDSGWATL